MTASEAWRALPGYEGRYDVSDLGRIRSWMPYHGLPVPRVMHPSVKNSVGHLMVSLRPPGGGRAVMCVHRAVLLAFVGPKPKGLVTRHLDGNPANNQLGNLRYGTYSENEIDKIAHGRHRNAGKTHCKRGHEFSVENTITLSNRKGRACRECRRLTHREGERRRRRERRAVA